MLTDVSISIINVKNESWMSEIHLHSWNRDMGFIKKRRSYVWLCPSNAVVLVCSFFFLQRHPSSSRMSCSSDAPFIYWFLPCTSVFVLCAILSRPTGDIFSVCLCSLVTFCPDQGRRHELLIGERIQTCSNQHTPKCSFSSDFGHLIWKCLKMQNLNTQQ